MADCGKYLKRLSCYIDKELPVKEAARFRRHLVKCAACRERLAAYGTISNAVAEALEEPAAELSSQIMKNVRAVAAEPFNNSGKKKPALKPILISSAAAAACLALVLLGMPGLLNLMQRQVLDVPGVACASAPGSDGGVGLNAAMKFAEAGGTESSGAYDAALSEPAPSGDVNFKAYYATFFIKGQLPESLKDSAMKDNGDGTYSVEISVQTAQRLMKNGYTAVMGSENMEKALVVYSVQ